MIKKIKDSLPLLLVNLLILSLCLIKMGSKPMVWVSEGIFLITYYLKVLRSTPGKEYVSISEGILKVNGVFHNFTIQHANVSDVQYRRDLFAKIFDLDLMVIETPAKRTTIYIRRAYQ